MTPRTKTIAVVCADLPDRNTGMVTVDLAAHALLGRLFPAARVTLYTLGRGGASPYAPGETAHGYRDLAAHADEFLAADVLLYWGDFIHSCAYWELDMKRWNPQLMVAMDPSAKRTLIEQQEQLRSRLLFLSGQPRERLRQAIVFGSTIITNEAADAAFAGYTRDFERFFAQAGAVCFRDALSAAKVSPLRGDEATLACDNALLLEDGDLARLPGFTAAAERRDLGVYFGRSSAKLRMSLFAWLLGRALGTPGRWVPWLPVTDKMRLAGRLLGYRVPDTDAAPGAILSDLSGCEFVVTDTYHLCVNAWRMGIPAVCIGEGANTAFSSVADKKKEVLYEMYGARQLYVFSERLRSSRRMFDEARRVATVLRDGRYAGTVVQNIQAHRAAALRRLHSAVSRALAHAERHDADRGDEAEAPAAGAAQGDGGRLVRAPLVQA